MRYETMKEAARALGAFCDDHEECDGCSLEALCDILPASLPKLLSGIAENKEKSK